jgi:hypothetical protein
VKGDWRSGCGPAIPRSMKAVAILLANAAKLAEQ